MRRAWRSTGSTRGESLEALSRRRAWSYRSTRGESLEALSREESGRGAHLRIAGGAVVTRGGESLEALSREAGVEIYRLDAWRIAGGAVP